MCLSNGDFDGGPELGIKRTGGMESELDSAWFGGREKSYTRCCVSLAPLIFFEMPELPSVSPHPVNELISEF